MTGLRLIVNADDYGLSRSVNDGIERAHLEGVVTSTTVMANQAAAADVERLRERCPRLGVGVHLTLTLGKPLAPPASVRTLLGPDEELLPLRSLVERARLGAVDPQHVERECIAQVEALRQLGVEPDHWDAHQHVQEYRLIGDGIAAAMAAAGVSRARCTRRIRVGAGRLAPGALARDFRRRRATSTLPNRFGAPDALFDAAVEAWERGLRRLPDSLIEAVCHPGATGPRAPELALLVHPALALSVRAREATLTTFRDALEMPGSLAACASPPSRAWSHWGSC